MITNFALLTTFLFFFNHLLQHKRLVTNRSKTVIYSGMMHGMCGLLLLYFSYSLNDRTFIDFRHVIMMSAAYFGGWRASFLTILILLIGRSTMFGEFTESSMIGLYSILISGIASTFFMYNVKKFWSKWFYATGFSMLLILILSLLTGFDIKILSYMFFVGCGGLITATLISYFSKTQRLATELKESESEYRSLHAMHEAIFHSAVHTSIMVFDRNGHITHTNQAAEKMLGYSINELMLMKTPLATFHATKKSELKEINEEHEWSYTRKDGSEITLLLTISPLMNGNELQGHVVVATDITEQKKMENWFKQLSTMDELTGLRNRRMFDETIHLEVDKRKKRAKRKCFYTHIV